MGTAQGVSAPAPRVRILPPFPVLHKCMQVSQSDRHIDSPDLNHEHFMKRMKYVVPAVAWVPGTNTQGGSLPSVLKVVLWVWS